MEGEDDGIKHRHVENFFYLTGDALGSVGGYVT